MMILSEKLADNLKRIKGNIEDACTKVNRNPADVKVVAVTKSVEIDIIQCLIKMGHVDIGESRVQEMVQREAIIKQSFTRKLEPLSATPRPELTQPRWHMVGHLQRNKVKPLLPFIEMIHSLDSLRLAEEINTSAAKLGLNHKVKILLQIKTSKEKQKDGLAVGALSSLAETISSLPNIEICGLMTMAPADDLKKASFCFNRCREIYEDMAKEPFITPRFKHLSMGMSGDYIQAVEAGATIVRIGRTLFE